MLRVGFLPSDFNPMILILGEAEDLRRLAGVLRRFANNPVDLLLGEPDFCPAPRTSVIVTASQGAAGIRPVADQRFVWRLDAELAASFADQIDQLAVPSRTAGSAILECTVEEEIPVKVSRGEYTDDFLR